MKIVEANAQAGVSNEEFWHVFVNIKARIKQHIQVEKSKAKRDWLILIKLKLSEARKGRVVVNRLRRSG